MKTNDELLREENRKLGIELGFEGGRARYEWKQVEDCWLPRAERDSDGKVIYDHVADPETGLIKVQAKIGKQSMCPLLHPKQWVLCRFLAPPTREYWEANFASTVPYPAQGYFAPTNVELDLDIAPWDSHQGYTITEHIVGITRTQEKKSLREHYNDGERAVELAEKEKDRLLEDQILDLVLPFPNAPHVPGKKGGAVSVPSTSQDAGASRPPQKANN